MASPAGTEPDTRCYVVAGGAGVVGECVVRALIDHGARVAVPSRSHERFDALRDRIASPNLHGFVADVTDLDSATALETEITGTLGPIDGVVATIGGWWAGPHLASLDIRTWHEMVNSHLTSHFVVARAFLPALADRTESVYVTTGGIAAVHPEPGSGPVSITGAAQAMMMRVLAAELAGRAVRVHEVDIYTPVVTDRWDDSEIQPDWLTGRDVGDYIAGVLRPGFPDAGSLFLSLPDDSARQRATRAEPYR